MLSRIVSSILRSVPFMSVPCGVRVLPILGLMTALAVIWSLTQAPAQARTVARQVMTTSTPSPTTDSTSTAVPLTSVEETAAITVRTQTPQTTDKWSWTEWLVSFTSNLLSSAIWATVLYFAITQPLGILAQRRRKRQLLGMLKSEMETNLERVKRCIELLEPVEDVDGKPLLEKIRMGKFSDVTADEARDLGAKIPRKYTRGVWNALKEDGFLTQLSDPQLIFYLLRTNEAMVVADTSRRTLRNELLKGTTDIDVLAQRALLDSKNLLMGLNAVLPLLTQMNLPVFLAGDIPVNEGD